MYDLPPILSGSSAQQLKTLRDYLVRMARQLNEAAAAPTATAAEGGARTQARALGAATGSAADTAAARKNAQALRALIIKTADGLSGDIESSERAIKAYADERVQTMSESCLARSEFGTFTENIEAQIANTARGVVESYGYSESIASAAAELSVMQAYMTDIDGEIRRGLVRDMETDELVTGIAIAQNLQFTGEISRGEDGLNYYTLSSGQTFGLYTSTGWQFWIDGCKRGWYDSVDGMLHIANVAVERAMELGAGWLIVNDNGLGIRHTGA